MPDYQNANYETAFKRAAVDTTAPLGGAAVYTGAAIDLGLDDGLVEAALVVATGRANVTGTLAIQESADGATGWVPVVSEATVQIGGTGDFIANASTVVRRRYIRLVYTNGAGAQGTFELDHVIVA